MQISDYSSQALSTDTFDQSKPKDPGSHAFLSKILGLSGEAGEVAEKMKKILRDQNGEMTETDKKEFIKELGDILWYINSTAHYLGYTLDDVAQANLDKVLSRKARGVSHGSGDNR
ncbi:nucleoside triphosphate pyrophosphohydrolase family protein [Candidatus Saccharibacteria bacterium]|nr:nucleoside triphosphate pyrophosphohydrolase family protein [Candidatus Saccharibacteria bacterium]